MMKEPSTFPAPIIRHPQILPQHFSDGSRGIGAGVVSPKVGESLIVGVGVIYFIPLRRGVR